MRPIQQFSDLVIFIDEIVNEKLHFLCSEMPFNCPELLTQSGFDRSRLVTHISLLILV